MSVNNTLNPFIKWLVSALVPGFATGSALLAAGVGATTFAFWWGVGGAIVGGLAGKSMTVAGDNVISKRKGE